MNVTIGAMGMYGKMANVLIHCYVHWKIRVSAVRRANVWAIRAVTGMWPSDIYLNLKVAQNVMAWMSGAPVHAVPINVKQGINLVAACVPNVTMGIIKTKKMNACLTPQERGLVIYQLSQMKMVTVLNFHWMIPVLKTLLIA